MPERQEDPSPEQIHEACQVIQAGWTEKERARRYVGGRLEWLASAWPECPEDGELSGW